MIRIWEKVIFFFLRSPFRRAEKSIFYFVVTRINWLWPKSIRTLNIGNGIIWEFGNCPNFVRYTYVLCSKGWIKVFIETNKKAIHIFSLLLKQQSRKHAESQNELADELTLLHISPRYVYITSPKAWHDNKIHQVVAL